MDPLVIVIALVAMILIATLFNKLGSNPIFQQIGVGIMYFLIIFIAWQLLLLLVTETAKKWFLSVACGGLFLLFLVYFFKAFKTKPRRIIIITLAAVVLLNVSLIIFI